MSHTLEIPGAPAVDLDEKGYLTQREQWQPEVADIMAAADGVELSSDHWVVIKIFQDYFDAHEIEPPMRALVRLVRAALSEEKGSSRYLYRLFPDGPTTQASRYAGLPRPLSCL